jgi:hypothetical protein
MFFITYHRIINIQSQHFQSANVLFLNLLFISINTLLNWARAMPKSLYFLNLNSLRHEKTTDSSKVCIVFNVTNLFAPIKNVLYQLKTFCSKIILTDDFVNLTEYRKELTEV